MKFSSAVLSYVLWTARSSRAFGVSARRSSSSITINRRRTGALSSVPSLSSSSSPAVCPWGAAANSILMRGGGAGGATDDSKSSTMTRLQSTATQTEDATQQQPVEVYRTDYKPLPFTVDQVEMDFDIRDGKTVVKTSLVWKKNPVADNDKMILDGDETCVTLQSIQLNGKTLTADVDYILKPGQMELLVDLHDGDKLETVVEIVPEDNTQLSGLYKSGSMYCTQCEALGFRRITYFPDRPDIMATFSRVRLEADKEAYPVLLSNGNLVEQGEVDGQSSGRHYAVWSDPFPKPSYLFAAVVGKLGSIKDSYVTRPSGNKVHLEIFSEPDNVHKLTYAMESLKNSMKWDEDRFGLEYDLGIYNVVATNDFNMGYVATV